MKRKVNICIGLLLIEALLLVASASMIGGCTMGPGCASDRLAVSPTPWVKTSDMASTDRSAGNAGCDPDSLASADEAVMPPSTEWGSGDVDFAPALIVGVTSDPPGIRLRSGMIGTSHYLEPK